MVFHHHGNENRIFDDKRVHHPFYHLAKARS
jgi:hypothetical protein